MARVCLVRADATVGTVGPAALLDCLVDLDVVDEAVVDVQTFEFCVCLCVYQQIQQIFGTLEWPAGLGAWGVDLLGLGVSATSAGEALEGYNLFLVNNVLQVLLCAFQVPVLQHGRGFTGVFEMRAQLVAAGLDHLGLVFWVYRVLDHFVNKK